ACLHLSSTSGVLEGAPRTPGLEHARGPGRGQSSRAVFLAARRRPVRVDFFAATRSADPRARSDSWVGTVRREGKAMSSRSVLVFVCGLIAGGACVVSFMPSKVAGVVAQEVAARDPVAAARPDDGKLRIIAFGAHPDDCEIQIGGVAALWAKAGHHVKFVSLTNGDIGHWHEAGGPLAQR